MKADSSAHRWSRWTDCAWALLAVGLMGCAILLHLVIGSSLSPDWVFYAILALFIAITVGGMIWLVVRVRRDAAAAKAYSQIGLRELILIPPAVTVMVAMAAAIVPKWNGLSVAVLLGAVHLWAVFDANRAGMIRTPPRFLYLAGSVVFGLGLMFLVSNLVLCAAVAVIAGENLFLIMFGLSDDNRHPGHPIHAVFTLARIGVVALPAGFGLRWLARYWE